MFIFACVIQGVCKWLLIKSACLKKPQSDYNSAGADLIIVFNALLAYV